MDNCILSQWQEKTSQLNELFQYSDLMEILDFFMTVPSAPFAVASVADSTLEEWYALQLWRLVFEHQIDSLLLLMTHRIDAGFALIRLTAELSRNLARIGEDWKLINKLFKASPKKRRYISEGIKFKLEDPAEKAVFDLYNMFSAYGVHGHFSTLMSLVPNSEIQIEGKTALGVSKEMLIKHLGLWAATIFPIHNLCMRSFKHLIIKTEPRVIGDFVDGYTQSEEYIKLLRNYSCAENERNRG